MNVPSQLLNLPAPAKLNLFLHVVGRRADGYHLLQSAFMLIDWQDTIDLTLRTDGHITRTQEGTGTSDLPADDLCVRAAQALQQATGCRHGAHIHLRKHIPMQAGLGGGSSDAATVLLGLNRLWNTGLSNTQLQHIGLTLGADVPFFLFGRNAWVEGIGEALQPIELPPARFVVIQPPAGLATTAIFSAPDLPRNTLPVAKNDFLNSASLWSFGRNDLQIPAQRLCPAIADTIAWLADLGLQARMTGSGSAVFAPLPETMDADILQHPPQKNCKIRVCSNLPHHPLLQCRA
ncbi:MAG: 4-(cytidine 5'-diphospho)-2-C-methyl-D-erythritol kinase [Brachymonas sp.]|nr:4-(cytidine 5'-diphospho)-2-C-methyl-D-erythritol kinase [Brachymonas sp.]